MFPRFGRILRCRFKNEELEDSLLVLDDVSSDSVVEAFDIGCKILITTDDKSIMNKTSNGVHYVKVGNRFRQYVRCFRCRIFSPGISPTAAREKR